MPIDVQTIEAPLTRDELAARWQALCNDPIFEDVPGKIELTEWGEILMSPVGKLHGLVAVKVAELLSQSLGGRTMVEVGVATAIGVRAPDVAWCSDAYLAAHPEDMPLSSAPEICVAIASSGSPMPKLREKALAFVNAGAVEAWILLAQTRQIEIYGRGGRQEATTFPVDTGKLFE